MTKCAALTNYGAGTDWCGQSEKALAKETPGVWSLNAIRARTGYACLYASIEPLGQAVKSGLHVLSSHQGRAHRLLTTSILLGMDRIICSVT